jgi:hypothetical protein
MPAFAALALRRSDTDESHAPQARLSAVRWLMGLEPTTLPREVAPSALNSARANFGLS